MMSRAVCVDLLLGSGTFRLDFHSNSNLLHCTVLAEVRQTRTFLQFMLKERSASHSPCARGILGLRNSAMEIISSERTVHVEVLNRSHRLFVYFDRNLIP